MADQKLIDYINQCLQAGQTKEQIRIALIASGWALADIDAALGIQDVMPSATVAGLQIQPNTLEKFSYKEHLGSLLPLSLAIVVALGITEFFAYAQNTAVNISLPAKIILDVIEIIGYLVAIWFGAALTMYVARTSEGVSAAIDTSLHKLHSYIWIAVLTGCIVLFGSLLFGIFGIIFSTWFAFATFVLAQEDARGLSALLKSKEYVRGWWVKVFVRIAIICAVATAGGFILSLVSKYGNVWLAGGLAVIAFLFYIPFAIVMLYNMFVEIKSVKGIVPVPVKGRGMFATFAVLGFLAPIAIVLLWAFMLAALFHNGVKSQPNTATSNIYTPTTTTTQQQQTTSVPESVQANLAMQEATRDNKRLLDTKNLATTLSFYYKSYNTYPVSLNALTPVYYTVLPTAPVPPDGNCTAIQNTYTYTQLSGGASYTLTFCIGETIDVTSTIPAGIHTYTPAGMQ
jgi:hypothetical protein